MRIFHVDAFASRPFAGNPAAVCLVAGDEGSAWMQAVAAEMNLPETAFVERLPEPGRFGLRWFTPTTEADLCGHATIAAAHALWQEGEEEAVLRFETRSGELAARRAGERITIDLPADPAEAIEPPPGLAEALGCELLWAGRGRLDFLVEVADEATVRALAPDLAAVARYDPRGVIVTAAADPDGGTGADFVSRFFAPGSGIDEDPVTGSAHCTLAGYWAPLLGRTEMTGYQASPRGGHVGLCLAGDRVEVSGAAVTVAHGHLLAG